jgi:hypothetical protein
LMIGIMIGTGKLFLQLGGLLNSGHVPPAQHPLQG